MNDATILQLIVVDRHATFSWCNMNVRENSTKHVALDDLHDVWLTLLYNTNWSYWTSL